MRTPSVLVNVVVENSRHSIALLWGLKPLFKVWVGKEEAQRDDGRKNR